MNLNAKANSTISKLMMMERQLKGEEDGSRVEERERRGKPVAVTIKLLTNSVQIVSSNDHLI